MKILVLNGSPRKGNTVTMIGALKEGIGAEHEVEVVDAYKLNVGPCRACDVCQCKNGCVAKDDTNMIVDKIVAADALVFASPVYWWGITAQLKLVIDKCYCRGALLGGKKMGALIVGGSATDNPQYAIIKKQFECISDYLSWDILFHNSYFASAKEDLMNDADAVAEIRELGKLF